MSNISCVQSWVSPRSKSSTHQPGTHLRRHCSVKNRRREIYWNVSHLGIERTIEKTTNSLPQNENISQFILIFSFNTRQLPPRRCPGASTAAASADRWRVLDPCVPPLSTAQSRPRRRRRRSHAGAHARAHSHWAWLRAPTSPTADQTRSLPRGESAKGNTHNAVSQRARPRTWQPVTSAPSLSEAARLEPRSLATNK